MSCELTAEFGYGSIGERLLMLHVEPTFHQVTLSEKMRHDLHVSICFEGEASNLEVATIFSTYNHLKTTLFFSHCTQGGTLVLAPHCIVAQDALLVAMHKGGSYGDRELHISALTWEG
jgi:hypothetical protein